MQEWQYGPFGNALNYAARLGHTDVAELLINMGICDINIHDEVLSSVLINDVFIDCQAFLRTPLHYAAMYGHFSTVNMLLEKGANITAMDLVSCNSFFYSLSFMIKYFYVLFTVVLFPCIVIQLCNVVIDVVIVWFQVAFLLLKFKLQLQLLLI